MNTYIYKTQRWKLRKRQIIYIFTNTRTGWKMMILSYILYKKFVIFLIFYIKEPKGFNSDTKNYDNWFLFQKYYSTVRRSGSVGFQGEPKTNTIGRHFLYSISYSYAIHVHHFYASYVCALIKIDFQCSVLKHK